MHGCELLFDAETAARVIAQVRAASGGECPCDKGQRCPMLPDDVGSLFSGPPLPTQRSMAATGAVTPPSATDAA